MFLLFFNLYKAMFIGEWSPWDYAGIVEFVKPQLNTIGQFVTSIFGDGTMNNLGDLLGTTINTSFILTLSLILAIITSIGIVVLAVKGIKRIFAVFFTFGR